MAFSLPAKGRLRAEINMTPMIDVLLVLIIVFMVVVVSISNTKGLDAHIPQSNQSQSLTPRTIVIQILAAGNRPVPGSRINDEVIGWEGLHDRLLDIFKQRAERVAFVKGDNDIDFEYVADAISVARSSGVDAVGLLTNDQPTK